MSRVPIIAGNWKMNTTLAEGLALVDQMLPRLQELGGVERVVCPPFISLAAIADRLRGTDIAVGAQNLHPEPKGAFTGEVSAGMLQGLATHVILGHSERRQYFGEDDALVNRKARAALAAGLVPIVCVGETLEQCERGETAALVERQVRGALEGLASLGLLVLAYEPIWAIGTGRAATAEDANETIGLIRRAVAATAGADAAAAVRIQYGGSVTAENFGQYIGQREIDGALVGGASLKADQFLEIVRLAQPG
ncbi:MAG: triose-phosphate isomerase [Chloroflexi bacterium]|nr:triose-phosphate isomerase [Chloroflexota bacterium]